MKNDLKLREVPNIIPGIFAEHYIHFAAFQKDERFAIYWNKCMDAVRDTELLNNIIFCNNALRIPPVKVFLLVNEKFFTEEANLKLLDNKIHDFVKRGIGAFWGAVFKGALGYTSNKSVAASMTNFGIKTASIFEGEKKIMKFTVLRGTKHIGGSIVKVSEGDKSILLDCGRMLPDIEQDKSEDNFDMAKLGEISAVFLTHHHGDHVGLIEKLPQGIPIYATDGTIKTLTAIGEYIGKPAKQMIELRPNEPVTIAEGFTVTAIPTEHSAHDAAMLLVEGGGKRLLYTGDFKTAPKNMLPKDVDFLLTEGTMLPRDGQKFPDQESVTEAFKEAFKEAKLKKPNGHIFILQSTTNFEHIKSVMKARKEVCPERVVMQDSFMKYVLTACDMGDFINKYAFVTYGFNENTPEAILKIHTEMKKRGELTGDNAFDKFPDAIVFIRKSMLGMLKRLKGKVLDFPKPTLIYAMWEGYKKDPATKALLDFFHSFDVKEQDIHTSGHADKAEIERFVKLINPKKAACIHSDNASLFKGIYSSAVPLDDWVEVEV